MAIVSRSKTCSGTSPVCARPSALSAGPCWWLPSRTSWCWPVLWWQRCACRGKAARVRSRPGKSAGPWPEFLSLWAHLPTRPKHAENRRAGPKAGSGPLPHAFRSSKNPHPCPKSVANGPKLTFVSPIVPLLNLATRFGWDLISLNSNLIDECTKSGIDFPEKGDEHHVDIAEQAHHLSNTDWPPIRSN